MAIVRIGLDIAKLVFQIHGVDGHGKAVLKKILSRSEMLGYFAKLPACLIGIEACAGAHYWARELSRLGHDARLMASQFVSAYRKSGKNDANDAEADAVARSDACVGQRDFFRVEHDSARGDQSAGGAGAALQEFAAG